MNKGVALMIFLGFLGCQTGRVFVDQDYKNWNLKQKPENKEVKHTVFLVGDVGKEGLSTEEPALQLIERQLDPSDEHTSVVFLGNNIAANGMPAEGDLQREAAEEILKVSLDLVKDIDGKAFFIPGNKDWNNGNAGGREAILRQEAFIEEYLDDKDAFQPENACGDPGVIQLEDDLTLVILDSQWYLQDWTEEDNINKSCKVDTRYELREKLAEVFDEYDDGNFIVAFHHPIVSAGPRGGYSSVKEHLFPFTAAQRGLYLPLPALGSIYPALRNLGAFKQDIPHPRYQAFIDLVQDLTFDIGHVVFASGHERILQYHEDNSGFRIFNVIKSQRHFIGSGAGSQVSFLRKNAGAEFASSKTGFSKLLYYQNGEVWLEMWAPIEGGDEGELLFSLKVKEEDISQSENLPEVEMDKQESLENLGDSVIAVADDIYQAGKTKQKLLGKLYRDVWTAPLSFPVANLDTLFGGLTPIKKGGGIQTKSLRLVNPDGKEYVMRSVKKDISLLIPEFARNTVVQDIAQDELSMAHPYGAWVVPPMAKAAGVYHTNPNFYYVPFQPALGEYAEFFGGQVYLIEERPEEPKKGKTGANFGDAKEIVSTRELLRKMRESHDNKADQDAVVRARLLDFWLGDWDRHDDQWRWAEFKGEDVDLYRPIPRDRDQVFISIDGIVPYLLTREWAARMFQDFDYDIRDIQGLAFNARYFDRTFMNEQDLSDWERIATELQSSLTDEAIEKGLARWPDKLYELHGEEIQDKLKVRREKLVVFARRYYKYLAREVDIVGSEDRELFLVSRQNEDETLLQVYHTNKKGEKKGLLYERLFKASETKEVRLYGRKGDDIFNITGEAEKGVRIRVIGGLDDDFISDNSRVGGGKRTIVYDTKAGSTLNLGKEAKDKTSIDNQVNIYDRKAFKLNSYLPLVFPGFNRDEGPTLVAGIMWTRQGFRKSPYKSNQQIMANYAFITQAFELSYRGDFIGLLGNFDLHVDASATAPFFVYNFFGLGNNTIYTDEFDDDFDINRIRSSTVKLFPGVQKSFNNKIHELKLGPVYEFTEVEATEGRFVATEASGLGPEDFLAKHYAGLRFNYDLDTRDNSINPTRGFKFNVQSGWLINAEDSDMSFFRFSTDVSFYHLIRRPIPIVFATRAGYATNLGDYEFFQANTLGGRTNLRGFRGERFAGDDAFYHNLEVRIPFYQSKNYFLPFRLGVLGFYDYGRVWLEGETSGDIHSGYGGGLLIAPYSTVAINLLYARSEEFDNIIFRLGFFF